MGIRRRLFAVQAATLGIVSAGAIGGWALQHWIAQEPRRELSRLNEERHHLAHMSFELLSALPHTGLYQMAGPLGQRQLIRDDINRLSTFRSRVDQHLADLSLSATDPQLLRELETIRLLAVQVEQNLSRADRELGLALDQARAPDQAVVSRALGDPGIALIRSHGEMLADLDSRLDDQQQRQERLRRRALEIGILVWSALLVLAWTIGLIQAWRTSRRLLEPLVRLERLMQAPPEQVALSLSQHSFADAPREIASLSRSFHALALQVQELLAAQASQLRTDGLTAVGNRRLFDEQLEQEWRRAIRRQDCLSLLLLDVDHFKLYNDCYGHQQGDRCLRLVATAISERARRGTDSVCRIGGEEFAVLLPAANEREAADLAHQIVAAIDALAIEHADSPVAGWVTASIGVASCRPRSGQDPANLVEQADAALYERKKRHGRHGVSLASGAEGSP